MNDRHEQELHEEFIRNGKRYTSSNGRYTVCRIPEGLHVHATALAREQWVSTDPIGLLSEAIALAEKWDSEDAGRLISTKEAAQRLGVQIRRIQQLIERKQLQAIPFGRDWLIDPADLQNLPPPQKRGPKPKK